MNYKKILSLVSVTLLVFLVVGTIAVYTNNSSETLLFKKDHQFRTNNKVNQYTRLSKCMEQCESEGGYNCGRNAIACCENEESCVSKWGMKVCKQKKDFDCEVF